MPDFLKQNLGLKLISLLLAIVFWLYTAIFINPLTETTISEVPIKYVNKEQLNNQDLTVEALDPVYVTVKVRAPRGLINNINKKNISATVNVSEVEETGTVSLPVSVTLPFEEAVVLEKNVYYATATVGKLHSKAFPLKVEIADQPASQYVEQKTLSPEHITVRAPEAILSEIDVVAAVFSLPGTYGGTSITATPVAYAKDGSEVLADNLLFDPEEVTLNCMVYKRKTVPLIVTYSFDETAYDIELSEESITIYGTPEEVDEVEEVYSRALQEIVGQELPVDPILPSGIYTDEEITVIIQ